jgi:hypothetical protein
MSGMIWNLEFQVGSPRLSWFRTNRLAPVSKFELCTGAYEISWSPTNWVPLCIAEMEDILPYLTGVLLDSAWCTHGVSAEAYAWKMCTRVWWALIVSLTTSWTIVTRSALLAYMCHVVRFLFWQGLNWLKSLWYPRIWVTLACCSHSIELCHHYVKWEHHEGWWLLCSHGFW